MQDRAVGAGGHVATRYRICVRGQQLDPSWSDRMAGLQITATTDPEGPLTTLEGPVRDQSELTGVLDTLNDLNLKLVSVQSLPPPRNEGTDAIERGGSVSTEQRRSR
jgi:hypothetical protein